MIIIYCCPSYCSVRPNSRYRYSQYRSKAYPQETLFLYRAPDEEGGGGGGVALEQQKPQHLFSVRGALPLSRGMGWIYKGPSTRTLYHSWRLAGWRKRKPPQGT